MKIQQGIKWTLIICFIAILLFPMVLADFSGGKISASENRILATPPTYAGDLKAFNTGMESWLNDNVGFRDAARKAVTYLEYHLFQNSAKSSDLLGKENWIYYYTQDILDDFTGAQSFSQNERQTFTDAMQTITRELSARGCETLFVIAPDKKSVYPEFYPNGIHRIAEKSRMTLLCEELAHQGVNILNLQPAMEQSKAAGTLYSPRIDDAHWNALGAFVGYQATCERLKELSPRMLALSDCTIASYEKKGLFNGTVPISEYDYEIHTGFENSFTDTSFELGTLQKLLYNQDASTYQKRFTSETHTLPKLLYVGDSYMQRGMWFYPQSFSEVTYLHFSDMAEFWTVQETFLPDVVVFESAERMLTFWQAQLVTCVQSITPQ
ncbi:MAG: hypothetical protein RR696_08525 [Clostridia bacterium]